MAREPWVNFSNAEAEVDCAIFLSPNRMERVHVYVRPNGSFGCRNFVWIVEEPYYTGWTVGKDWGHHYDCISTAIREAQGLYPWLASYLDA